MSFFKHYSWKTSAAGIITVLTALGAMVLNPLLDNDPATLPQWGAFFTSMAAAIGLLQARDDNKSSEQVGAGVIPKNTNSKG